MSEGGRKEPDTIRVYYNSACPVCRAGIESQKGKQAACPIDWNDVHQDNALVSAVGSELAFVRKRLHVIDEHGQVQVGFDAFLTIWRNTPEEVWKARLFGVPGVRQLCSVGYNLFAALLYRCNRFKRRW